MSRELLAAIIVAVVPWAQLVWLNFWLGVCGLIVQACGLAWMVWMLIRDWR